MMFFSDELTMTLTGVKVIFSLGVPAEYTGVVHHIKNENYLLKPIKLIFVKCFARKLFIAIFLPITVWVDILLNNAETDY